MLLTCVIYLLMLMLMSRDIEYFLMFDHQARVRVWFVRLYGKIIHERERVDYRPYRRTNHTLTSLLHLYASTPCMMLNF